MYAFAAEISLKYAIIASLKTALTNSILYLLHKQFKRRMLFDAETYRPEELVFGTTTAVRFDCNPGIARPNAHTSAARFVGSPTSGKPVWHP
jgi:hypothetical protein